MCAMHMQLFSGFIEAYSVSLEYKFPKLHKSSSKTKLEAGLLSILVQFGRTSPSPQDTEFQP